MLSSNIGRLMFKDTNRYYTHRHKDLFTRNVINVLKAYHGEVEKKEKNTGNISFAYNFFFYLCNMNLPFFPVFHHFHMKKKCGKQNIFLECFLFKYYHDKIFTKK